MTENIIMLSIGCGSIVAIVLLLILHQLFLFGGNWGPLPYYVGVVVCVASFGAGVAEWNNHVSYDYPRTDVTPQRIASYEKNEANRLATPKIPLSLAVSITLGAAAAGIVCAAVAMEKEKSYRY